MDWKKYFEEMIKMLREEVNQLNEKKKAGAPMYNIASGYYGIDHWLRELDIAISGAILFLELLLRNGEIPENDARILKYKLGWLGTDILAIRLGTYPTLHPEFTEE